MRTNQCNNSVNTTTDKDNLIKDNWLQKWWRPTVAVTYLLISILDFAIMPVIYEIWQQAPKDIILMAQEFEEPSVQITIIQTFHQTKSWTPLTLMGGGLFHFAFGAIVAGSAITRGWEKKQRIATFGPLLGGAVIDQR